jgi:hypothetical protein
VKKKPPETGHEEGPLQLQHNEVTRGQPASSQALFMYDFRIPFIPLPGKARAVKFKEAGKRSTAGREGGQNMAKEAGPSVHDNKH